MNKTSRILIFFLAAMILSSCMDKERQGLKPMVSGKPGEVLLVIDTYLWESAFGEFFTEMCSEPFEALPVDEPIYDLIHIPSNGFNKLFKSHRNIFLTKISSQHKEPRIIVQKDLWAYPQLVVNLIGPNDSTMITYLEENRERLISLLEVDERNRTILNYRKNRAKGIDEILKSGHGLSISVPAGYEVGVDSNDFIWLSHEVADMSQGVFLYYYPYTDTNTFTSEYLIKKRDEYLRKYVAGPTKGSYMKTETRYPVIRNEMAKDGKYLVELRGLWNLEKAFMGGPFISHTILDEKNNRVVTVGGFVYAPSLDKRNYVRELEAILQTFELVD
ncbi:DUF4837 family protein [Bacteroidota bacterium]